MMILIIAITKHQKRLFWWVWSVDGDDMLIFALDRKMGEFGSRCLGNPGLGNEV